MYEELHTGIISFLHKAWTREITWPIYLIINSINTDLVSHSQTIWEREKWANIMFISSWKNTPWEHHHSVCVLNVSCLLIVSISQFYDSTEIKLALLLSVCQAWSYLGGPRRWNQEEIAKCCPRQRQRTSCSGLSCWWRRGWIFWWTMLATD